MKIIIRVQTISPDRTTYKQYSTVYVPENLCVRIEIPDEEVINTDKIILTEKGMEILMGKLADIPDRADNSYLHTKLPK